MHEFLSLLRTWYGLKRQTAALIQRLEKDKKEIKAALEKLGSADEKGSLVLSLPSPIDEIATLKNQRRVTDNFNEDEATRITKKIGIYGECVKMVPVFDPDAVRAAYFDKRITKTELDRIFPQTVSFSLVLLDKDGKQIK